jgi:hypothetical protein
MSANQRNAYGEDAREILRKRNVHKWCLRYQSTNSLSAALLSVGIIHLVADNTGVNRHTVQKIVRSPTCAGMRDVAEQSNITATATSTNVPATENKGLGTIVKAAFHKMYRLRIVPTLDKILTYLKECSEY